MTFAAKLRSLAGALMLLYAFCGCSPDKLEMEIYTADIQKALGADVVEVPISVSFSLLGEDDDNDLPKAAEVAKRYLGEDAEFRISKGDMGDSMVVKCRIPMGTSAGLKGYLASKHRPLALTIITDTKANTIKFGPTAFMKDLNQDLQGISGMLEVDLPANSTLVRIIGDSEKAPTISAIAVFVDEKPELVYRTTVERRKSIALEYKGDAASVYSQIPLQFSTTF